MHLNSVIHLHVIFVRNSQQDIQFFLAVISYLLWLNWRVFIVTTYCLFLEL
jgi:hypothetical protein